MKLNEQARRRHPRQKMRGIRLKLADGQRWHFQAPKPELALRRIGDQYYPDVKFVFGDHSEEIRHLVDLCGEPGPEKRGKPLVQTLWLANRSLRLQYRLTWGEAWELLHPLAEKWCDDVDPLGLLHRALLINPMKDAVAILDQVIDAARRADAEALRVG